VKNITDLHAGESATIIGFSGEMELQSRLVEMGVIPGTKIRFIKDTPFNGPVEIKVRDYYLSIRKNDAQRILIKHD